MSGRVQGGSVASVLLSFLFSDVVGSTRLWQEHPSEMSVALARHDEIMRAAFAAHDGHIFATAGDAFMVAFTSADAAVDAAVQAQQALAGEAWGTVRISVRMGLHIGPAEERDGDYFGTTLNRTARIMSLGDGGQVLLSTALHEFVRDHLHDGLVSVDVGERYLKSFNRPERIFQLFGPGLSEEQLAGGESRESGNLPTPSTSFIGRKVEVDEIVETIEPGRLVTLVGIGGAGKTRLSMEIARCCAVEFSQGAWWCDLTPLSSGADVASLVGSVLRTERTSESTMAESVVRGLSRRDVLVVLDNCEHVLDGAAELASVILSRCPGVALLATSREPLAVGGEQVWPVRPLDAEVEGVGLLLERARSADASIDIGSWDHAELTELCRKLDGIPLAIEMAAARLRSMSPRDLMDRLDDRFRLLRSGRRVGAADRHQTLIAMLDWSYGLLDPAEQLLLDRLVVFSGSFDLAAVETVCTDDPIDRRDVVDLIAALVDKSLMIAQRGETGVRYRLLDTVRQYGQAHLDQRGEAHALRLRHLSHFTRLADRAINTWLDHSYTSTAQPIFRQSWDDFLAAIEFAIAEGDSERCNILFRSCQPEGGMWRRDYVFADLAYDAISAALDVPAGYMAAAFLPHDDRERGPLAEAGLALLDTEDQKDGFLLLTQLGAAKIATGDSVAAVEIIKRGHRVAHHWGPSIQAYYDALLAVYSKQNEPDQAQRLRGRALAFVGDGHDPDGCLAAYLLGTYEAMSGRYDDANRLWITAAEVASEAGLSTVALIAAAQRAQLAVSRHTPEAPDLLLDLLSPDEDGRHWWYTTWPTLAAAADWLRACGDVEGWATIEGHTPSASLRRRSLFGGLEAPGDDTEPPDPAWLQRGSAMSDEDIVDYAIERVERQRA